MSLRNGDVRTGVEAVVLLQVPRTVFEGVHFGFLVVVEYLFPARYLVVAPLHAVHGKALRFGQR